ncbi:hypothetical protein BJ993_003107 [Nocardioides aromaticivorans]|uniref:Uncharacterized protein n=1 Tax=Nocardioides aromaticivorans TaxID=200618 RepID=A0A7Y9ZIH2_9ACTN|nr:hypothetical protein [Nocardioides aromaticivorans]NYI46027.1 hypothetical protein [Nocardioides aromaticivorans]
MIPVDEQLSAGLHRLTDTLAPSADPAGDLRRGRRRRRRTRLAVGCGSAVVAASALAVAVLPPGEEQAPVAEDPVTTPSATPVTTPASTASAAPATNRCIDLDDRGPGPNGTIVAAAPDLLDLYRTILVERLDPAERHLGPGRTNNQVGASGNDGCRAGQVRLTSYGTKLDWRVPGESGLGMIQVEVTSGPWQDAQMRYAYDFWAPRKVNLPGVRSAGVASYDGGVAVVVHRTDGLSVAIDANTLFGNNSLTPVSGMDVAVRDLLAAAADPRFTLE